MFKTNRKNKDEITNVYYVTPMESMMYINDDDGLSFEVEILSNNYL